MREILFRGKMENGLWRIGYLSFEDKITIKRKCYDYKGDYATTSIEEYKIDKNTIGQFTGLTDKNGKKIFEGDIVQGTIVSAWNKALIRCEVVYNKDGFISVERTRNQDWVHKVKFAKDIEVIGNIHDNPELLGE